MTTHPDGVQSTRVLIVAKTRMRSGACVGGIMPDGTSVRLIASDYETNPSFNMAYQVGEVWEVDYTSVSGLIPPHTENILVQNKCRLGRHHELAETILERMPPKDGGIEILYDGLTQHTTTGALYIAERSGVPAYSTMFWRPDRPLQLDDSAKRIRYRYPTPDGGRTLTFVGFQEPVETIPAGSLVRVSIGPLVARRRQTG